MDAQLLSPLAYLLNRARESLKTFHSKAIVITRAFSVNNSTYQKFS